MAPGRRLVQTRPTGHGRARGLVSSRESGRRVEASTYAPAADLVDIVECLWMGRWDLPPDAPHVTELLGDPAMHVVFERGSSRVVGVWTRLWRRTLEGRGLVRALKLRPGAARALFAQPAHDFTNRVVPLASVFEGVPALEDRVLAPIDEDEAFAVVEGWIRAERVHTPSVETLRAIACVEHVTKDAALGRVEALARVTEMGVRELQRLFREHVGASPKHVIRRVRLQEAALRIEKGELVTLADLAAELGYADQAHLARDFKLATGRSPSAFARTV